MPNERRPSSIMDRLVLRPAADVDAPAVASCVCEAYACLYLATHELMVENRALYQAIGYVEYDHRVVNGFPRVFLRKRLE